VNAVSAVGRSGAIAILCAVTALGPGGRGRLTPYPRCGLSGGAASAFQGLEA